MPHDEFAQPNLGHTTVVLLLDYYSINAEEDSNAGPLPQRYRGPTNPLKGEYHVKCCQTETVG